MLKKLQIQRKYILNTYQHGIIFIAIIKVYSGWPITSSIPHSIHFSGNIFLFTAALGVAIKFSVAVFILDITFYNFRYLLGWTRPSKFSLLKGVRNSIFKKAWDPVLQDYMVKLEDLNEFINYSHENIECYPLWLCPVRHTIDVYPDEVRELVKDDLTTSIIVDVGIYGYDNITSNTTRA